MADLGLKVTSGSGTKAVKSFQVEGRVEDMNAFITNIDPKQTFLTNKFGNTTVSSTEHQWLCDSLRPAMENATLEVVDFDSQEATPRRRESNYTQQFLHGYTVSDTTQAIKKYGVRDELAYQMVKASKEIARDLEYAIVRNKERVLGDSNTAVGKMGGIPYFLGAYKDVTYSANKYTVPNHKFVTGDAILMHAKSGTIDTKFKENTQYFVRVLDKDTFTIHPTDTDAMADTNKIEPTSGSLSNHQITHNNIIDAKVHDSKGEFTFDVLNDAMQLAWSRGGSVDIAVMSGKNKRKATTFNEQLQVTKAMDRKEIIDTVDVVETDFGRVELVAHRMYTDDAVDLLELQYWKKGFLIPFHQEEGPRTGTYKSKYITGSVTLECTAPIANARIVNISEPKKK